MLVIGTILIRKMERWLQEPKKSMGNNIALRLAVLWLLAGNKKMTNGTIMHQAVNRKKVG